MRTVENANQIIVLIDGVVAESGNHEELMQMNGEYRHLYDSQMTLENYGKEGTADV